MRINMFFLFVFAAFFVSGAHAGCPNGWVQHDNSCYHLSHVTETWFDSEVVCKTSGGHLVEIESATENNFIDNLLTTANVPYAWLGAYDLYVEGEWTWEHSRQQTSYTNWKSGEPNGRTNENCLMMLVGGKWNDEPCRYLLRYVCELPIGEEVVVG